MSTMALFWYVEKTEMLFPWPKLSMLFSQYSREVKRCVSFDCPHIIKMCNMFMGGTDKIDQNNNAYWIGIRGEKLWWTKFTRAVDVSIKKLLDSVSLFQ